MCKSSVLAIRGQGLMLQPTFAAQESESNVPQQRKKSKKRRQTQPVARPRNHCLDALRGFAILLMIVDHIADFLLEIPIEPSSIRMVTRLSMPLFCGLMGYFLVDVERIHWKRFYQLAFACVATSMASLVLYGKAEILASLLVCYLLFALLREKFLFLLFATALFSVDPSRAYFDYPLSIVAATVAQGMILKRLGLRWALLGGLLLLASAYFVAPPTRYVLWFALPATLLIMWAARRPALEIPGLSWIGRYPLSFYVVHYYVLIALTG